MIRTLIPHTSEIILIFHRKIKKSRKSSIYGTFFLRRDRVMNLLSYILEIQFIIKMSMP